MNRKDSVFYFKNRVIGLDLLRCLAIFYVFWGHGAILIPNEFKWLYSIPTIIPFEGVSVFFVLSGFLIGSILNNTIFKSEFKFKELLNFWIRRWYRTIPLYLIVLLVMIVLTNSLWNLNFLYFVFAQNLFWNHPEFFGVAWSLSVEEWFYLLFPGFIFLTFLVLKKKMSSLLIISLLFILVPFFMRCLYYNDINLDVRKIVFFRLDSMIYGVFASIIYFHKPDFWVKYKFISLLLSLILLAIIYSLPAYFKSSEIRIFIFNLESLSTMFLLPFLNSVKNFRFHLVNKVIVFISKISFSLYLIHGSLILWFFIRNIEFSHFILSFRFEVQRLILFLLYFLLSIGLATFMYIYIETPILKFRDRKTLHNHFK
jgi:peptidoglycan/LPS O-acetylase OafA/YrhL